MFSKWLLNNFYPPVPQSLLLVMLLQQAHAPEAHQRASGNSASGSEDQDCCRDSIENSPAYNSCPDAQNPFNELCSSVIAACLAAVQKGAKTISSRKISLFDGQGDSAAFDESQERFLKRGDTEVYNRSVFCGTVMYPE